jgi:hypothetical protein
MNLRIFQFSIPSIAIFTAIGLKLGILLCTKELQFMFRCNWIFFAKVKPLSLGKIFEFDSILDFFSLSTSLQLSHWNLVYHFVVKSCSSSSLFSGLIYYSFLKIDVRIMPRLRCSCSCLSFCHPPKTLTFWMVSDRALIFHISIPRDKTFPWVENFWSWPWYLTDLLKIWILNICYTLAISFDW